MGCGGRERIRAFCRSFCDTKAELQTSRHSVRTKPKTTQRDQETRQPLWPGRPQLRWPMFSKMFCPPIGTIREDKMAAVSHEAQRLESLRFSSTASRPQPRQEGKGQMVLMATERKRGDRR